MKKLSRSLLYFLLVSVAAFLVWHFEKPTQEKTGDVLNRIFLPDFDPQKVSAIQIEHLISGVKLKKENDEWVVTNSKTKIRENLNPAEKVPESWQKIDSGKLLTALNILKNLHVISLAGNNPERHGYFEVSPVGMQVWFYDSAGKELAKLYLGKMGAGFGESYIRKEGDNNVYLTDHFLRVLFPADAEKWK